MPSGESESLEMDRVMSHGKHIFSDSNAHYPILCRETRRNVHGPDLTSAGFIRIAMKGHVPSISRNTCTAWPNEAIHTCVEQWCTRLFKPACWTSRRCIADVVDGLGETLTGEEKHIRAVSCSHHAGRFNERTVRLIVCDQYHWWAGRSDACGTASAIRGSSSCGNVNTVSFDFHDPDRCQHNR